MPRKLSDWITGYLEYHSESESPIQYLQWAAISFVAAAAQRKCWMTRGMYYTYPNLYTLLVGPPAVGKGKAMGLGVELINKMGIHTAPESCSRRGLLDMFDESRDSVTINEEEYFHTSLSLYAPEVETLFARNDPELWSNLINIFDSGDDVKDITSKHGLKIYNNIWLNILGGIPTETLGRMIEKNVIGSGLASRILFIYADKIAQIVAYPGMSPNQLALKEYLQADLESIRMLKGEVKQTTAYSKRYKEWYDHNMEIENYPIKDPRFAPYCNRRCGLHLPKLVAIISLSEGDTMVADVPQFERALDILTQAEATMPLALAGAGLLGFTAQVLSEIRMTLAYKGEIRYSMLLGQYGHSIHEQDLWNIILTIERLGECHLEPRVPKDKELWPPEMKIMTTKGEIVNYLKKDNYRRRGEASDWMIIGNKK